MAKQVKSTGVTLLIPLLVLLASASGKSAVCEYMKVCASLFPVTYTEELWFRSFMENFWGAKYK
jgi:hypothetical protein